MKKIKIEELGCFNEVASVIGVAEAKRELFKVVSSRIVHSPGLSLGGAFMWGDSPQGFWFWSDIDEKITPKANP